MKDLFLIILFLGLSQCRFILVELDEGSEAVRENEAKNKTLGEEEEETIVVNGLECVSIQYSFKANKHVHTYSNCHTRLRCSSSCYLTVPLGFKFNRS